MTFDKISSPETKASEEHWGYNRHDPPVLDDDGAVPVLRIPNEPGYFPTGSSKALLLCSAKVFQMHPKYRTKRSRPIASGFLTLRDPSGGTATEVALVCECNGTSFYIRSDDPTKKIGPNEFMLLLPGDCIGVDLSDNTDPDLVLHFEALLAARTLFHDESSNGKKSKVEYPENLPTDTTSKTMYKMATWTSKVIVNVSDKAAVKIEGYGQKKMTSVTDVQEKEVKKSHIKMAEKSRRVSEKTREGVEKITGKISDTIGGTLSKHTEVNTKDSKTKTKARKLLLASAISYGEVADGAGEGYSIMATQAKKEAVSFVEKKYGRDAADLARHTAGAAVNFSSAALTTRR
eukprot:CAMPEP_0113528064 /NCGR_PEP_ID=MMETSP0015_2-20120614/1636_1 /TAXON_ID=2838 /ORGANISM="Odontella" /LENGTH=346 /DNA_ID=CAMNT_0000426553 /DNA_START=80 /DNA_END=1117 /DNA_ORIENTATION=- /assembly_acc=CAM_ASM_000160